MTVVRRVRRLAYHGFYLLPGYARRRLVRLVAPKYLVGAVNLITDANAGEPGRILLLRQPPGRRWGLPAGLLKHREAPPVGAARELYEETGVVVAPDDLTPAVPNAVVHREGWVDTVFTAAVSADDTVLRVDGGEVLEARWFPVDDLPPLTPNTALLFGVYGIGSAAGRRETR